LLQVVDMSIRYVKPIDYDDVAAISVRMKERQRQRSRSSIECSASPTVR